MTPRDGKSQPANRKDGVAMPDREIVKSKPVYGRRLLFTSIFFAALVVEKAQADAGND